MKIPARLDTALDEIEEAAESMEMTSHEIGSTPSGDKVLATKLFHMSCGLRLARAAVIEAYGGDPVLDEEAG